MKKLAIVSGKGGTGKTTVAASLASLAENKLLADCDVDAPNLHLLLPGERLAQADYFGAKVVVIDPVDCVRCGRCREVCRFGAIGPDLAINEHFCEGCGACTVACTTGAIQLREVKTGETYVTRAAQGVFAHARLACGAEGSGKLVTAVRENALAHRSAEETLLIDGAPGIGCVVIASLTGCDAALAVTEPTPSGRADLERVLAVAAHFRIPAAVCINKFDLNEAVSGEIVSFCRGQDVPVVGRIPFDPGVVDALRRLETPLTADGPAAPAIRTLWENLQAWFREEETK